LTGGAARGLLAQDAQQRQGDPHLGEIVAAPFGYHRRLGFEAAIAQVAPRPDARCRSLLRPS
jgi:hypothetical protein